MCTRQPHPCCPWNTRVLILPAPGMSLPPSVCTKVFLGSSLFVKNKLEAAPMINHQLLSAPPLAISAKGMNYLEKHPEGEPTVKENGKG